MSEDIKNKIFAAIMRIRKKSPFFGCLILYAEIIATDEVATAATDGETIFYNSDFIRDLQMEEIEGVIVHELLHCVLMHVSRIRDRDKRLWNIAADIVVNGIISDHGEFKLPVDALRNEDLEKYPTEEVYSLLESSGESYKADFVLDLNYDDSLKIKTSSTQMSQDVIKSIQSSSITNVNPLHQKKIIQQRWRSAIKNAEVIVRSRDYGWYPSNSSREFDELRSGNVDWRTRLWRFLVQSPSDFSGFDRRFISSGIYLDTLESDQLFVDVAIDTSSSINDEYLGMFISELKSILSSYPHIDCQLYYADAMLYGPWNMRKIRDLPDPIGGGGTSFVPFFERKQNNKRNKVSNVCIYFTDGYGLFPSSPSTVPVLWVVPPGGASDHEFPFGNVIHLRSTS